MKNKKRFIIQWVLAGLLSSPLYAHAQSPAIDSLVNRFNSYRVNNLQEKIYIHTDQETYLTGETIWFKAYCIEGTLHQPVDVSKVAYLEIVNQDHLPVVQTKIKLTSGLGDGYVFLPASLPSGNYFLRAYTHWMRNFSPEFFFQQRISIINSFQKLENQKALSGSAFDAHFFPEGGNLIADAENKVAFSITDSFGEAIDFEGSVVDDRKDTIVRFAPLKFGIGSFSFQPQSGRTYKAVVSDKRKKSILFDLPEILQEGYVLHVEENKPGISITIQRHSAALTPDVVYLFIHSRQRITKAQVLKLQDNRVTVTIPKGDLLDGISHITLFDPTLRPVCERLYYNGTGKSMNIEASTAGVRYEARTKVTVNIDVNNPGPGAVSNLSVSVVKDDSLRSEHSESILTYLGLTSDLQGRIKSPEYYLNLNDDVVKTAMDNLMLTHGWRRFVWQEVIEKKNQTHEFIPEFRGHFIFGKVSGLTGKPVGGIASYLSVPGKNIQLRAARSGGHGDVRFELLDFYGPKKVIAQIQSTNDSLYKIELISSFADKFSREKLKPYFVSPSLQNQLLRRSVGMQVQDIYYKEQNELLSYPRIDSSSFYGHPDEVYRLDDYTRFPVMEEVLKEYVRGVAVRKRNDQFHLQVMDDDKVAWLNEDPLILLDGLPVFDAGKILAYDPLKVQGLEVVRGIYFFGPLTFSGVVNFKTFDGDLPGFDIDPKTVTLNYEGLQLHREFFSPAYKNQQQREQRLPDRRSLLYWKPYLITGPDGKASVDFYTSDIKGTFNVRIEGISSDGAAGSKVISFEVK